MNRTASGKRFIPAAKVSDLPDGKMKSFRVENRDILVAMVGGKYYAADNKCPHLGGNLSRGSLEGTVVTCPLHGSQFDLAGGRVIRWTTWTGLKLWADSVFRSAIGRIPPQQPLRIYPVKVEGENIIVGI